MDRESARLGVRIRGVVQGVGFRPAMYRLADALGLGGFVNNDREGVWLEIEGRSPDLDRFVLSLVDSAPRASRIDRVELFPLGLLGEHRFRIAASREGTRSRSTTIPTDLAPCEDCLRELADPDARRFGYPFINCTACGPRFTIVRDVPYDRSKTTMAAFAMCRACRAEYDDPRDRRFHAEPIACHACGPRVWTVGGGPTRVGGAAIAAAAAAITSGAIVAIKGVGGYVLAVDATAERAVARLRARKRRPDKPLAVMARSLSALEPVAYLDDAARAWLTAPARPIVLVRARADTPLAAGIAPRLGDVGVFLPPSPLQQMLLATGPPLQVMTSGNQADEPIARTEDEALAQLDGIADVFLVHDREIHARADDSVVRSTRRGVIPMRRARGFVPEALELAGATIPLLAVGGHERTTVCLCHDGRAVLSQHIGDLDRPEAAASFDEVIERLSRLTGITPEAVAHDLHPDYRSTRWAIASGLPRVAVQHHHAHVAACLAEHGRSGRVLGVAFDGTGLGSDGTLWGGELLEADLGTSRRLGHLLPLPLPGGEAAIRQPWRLAIAALFVADQPLERLRGVEALQRHQLRALLEAGTAGELPMLRATGAGRWFDAVAALLGIGHVVSYDGQAAAELEALAARAPCEPAPLPFEILDRDPFVIDLRPAIAELACNAKTAVSRLARRFHDTLASAIAAGCRRARAAGGPSTVALTGGCFQNRILLEASIALLEADGFEVLVHRRVPCNDGGLALGQAAVASWRIAKEQADVPGSSR